MFKLHSKAHFKRVRREPLVIKPERRKHLTNLCLCINFDSIKLLDDTVTELIITYQQDTTIATPQRQNLCFKATPDAEPEYSLIVDHLRVIIREDPFRVRFPMYESSFGPNLTKDLSEVTKIQELGMGVHKAHVVGDKNAYVHKEVDRPLYEPRDIRLSYEEFLWSIIRMAHYKTYCSRLRQWAIQITSALSRLHQFGITHMDMKPLSLVVNIVRPHWLTLA
ncbi:hypothetical protein ACLOAV_004573 [Pseudogymnoascus australis]